jgi:hypothetical protein
MRGVKFRGGPEIHACPHGLGAVARRRGAGEWTYPDSGRMALEDGLVCEQTLAPRAVRKRVEYWLSGLSRLTSSAVAADVQRDEVFETAAASPVR